jgi:hypothetical protein
MLKIFQIIYNCKLPKLMPVTGTEVELTFQKWMSKCNTLQVNRRGKKKDKILRS